MTEYKDMTLAQFADLARESSAELGALDYGRVVNYETGDITPIFDEETCLFIASSREIVLELIKRLKASEAEKAAIIERGNQMLDALLTANNALGVRPYSTQAYAHQLIKETLLRLGGEDWHITEKGSDES